MTFVVVGEALVDIVVPFGGGDQTVNPGGSPLNVAVGLSRLGLPTLLVTQLGEDEHGAAIRRHVEGSGVVLAPGSIGARGTSTATAYLDETGAARYVFDLDWSIPPLDLPDDATALHLGSIGAALRPGRDSALALARQARDRRLLVSFDPNARPQFTPDADAAWADVLETAALCGLVKMSDEDLEFFQPGRDVESIAAELLALGPALVVVTFGGGGAHGFCAHGAIDVLSRPTDVVDTVGAGDSFMAALLTIAVEHGLLDLHPPVVAAYLAASHEAASITVSRRGANPPTRADLTAGWPHL